MQLLLRHLLVTLLITIDSLIGAYGKHIPSSSKSENRYSRHYLSRRWGAKPQTFYQPFQSEEEFGPGPGTHKSKADQRRGVNIDVRVVSPVPNDKDVSQFLSNLENDLVQEMGKALVGRNMSGKDFEKPGLCTDCEETVLESKLQQALHVQPAYHCDQWDYRTRTCWLERNIGDTVTFVLKIPNANDAKPKVTWRKEYHQRDTNIKKMFVIDPDAAMWNIVIGSRGLELRLSPVTETDVDFNRFSATINDERTEKTNPLNKVHFQIKIVPIDLGFVYLGETLELNMERFCSLPISGITFQWFLESDTESGTLPSNMRVSPSGSCMTVSELRKEQAGIITCSAYTNLGIFASKRRFLIREVSKSNDIMLGAADLKQHNEISVSEHPHLKRRSRPKRAANDVEDFVEDLEEEDSDMENNKQLREITENMDEELGDQQDLNPDGKHSVASREQLDDEYMEEAMGEEPRNPGRNLKNLKNRNPKQQSRKTKAKPKRLNFKKVITSAAKDNRGRGNELRISELPVSNVHVSEITNEDSSRNLDSKHGHQMLAPHILLDVEREKTTKYLRTEDMVSQFFATCSTDRECSGHALCTNKNPELPGFCRCFPGYHGEGVFCWEETKVRIGRVFNDEDTDTSTIP